MVLNRTRDEALYEPTRTGLDTSFASVLAITSATGLLLLFLRESTWMPLLLIVHLAFGYSRYFSRFHTASSCMASMERPSADQVLA